MENDCIDPRTIRLDLGWSQRQMAEYLGLDQASVSRMERGQSPKGPTRRLLEQLAGRPAEQQTDAALT